MDFVLKYKVPVISTDHTLYVSRIPNDTKAFI